VDTMVIAILIRY